MPSIIGQFRMKAPKIKSGADAFYNAVYDRASGLLLSEHFGEDLIQGDLAMWLKIPHFVGPHVDEIGKCLLYLHSGIGSLYVNDCRKQLNQLEMKPGDVAIFNDKAEHFWLSEKPCTIFACNVK